MFAVEVLYVVVRTPLNNRPPEVNSGQAERKRLAPAVQFNFHYFC